MKKSVVIIIALIMVSLLVVSSLGYVFLILKPKGNDHKLEEVDPADLVLPQNWTTNETIMEYLVSSGDYLLDKIKDDGMWVYEYDPGQDLELKTYNILRHAGTTYSLALIFKYTQDMRYYNGTIETLNYLMNERLIFEDVGEYEIAYIEYRSLAKLGGVALTMLGLTEAMKMNPELDYQRELDGMGNFLLMMMHDDGKFQCFYKSREDDHNDFYPGEALIALAKLYDLTGEQKYLDGLVLGLDFYVDYYKGTGYSAFTPWGTEAMLYAYEWTGNESYLTLCYQMAESCIGGQNRPGSTANPLHVGGWTSNPAANGASRIEGPIDSYLLAKRNNDWGRANRYFNASAMCGLFLMRLQFNETDSAGFPNPERTVGGTPLSFTDDNIRIDYVQHAVVVLVKILVYAHSYENI